MTAAETRPQPVVRDEAAGTGRLRPLDRRVLQAIALVCAVSAFLVLQWVDETNNVEKNLKPPEKVVAVEPGQIGELVGARWKVIRRKQARPLTSDASNANDVTELRLAVAVRPGDAASAEAVGSYGLVYRLLDDDGREWSTLATKEAEPRPGVAMLITVKGTVPRTKADSLELEIQAPKAARKRSEPLLSLRFER